MPRRQRPSCFVGCELALNPRSRPPHRSSRNGSRTNCKRFKARFRHNLALSSSLHHVRRVNVSRQSDRQHDSAADNATKRIESSFEANRRCDRSGQRSSATRSWYQPRVLDLLLGRTQEPNSAQTQDDAVVGTGSAATPAPSRASLGIEVVPSRGAIPGLKVVRFNDGSYADEAGLQLDDVIVAVDGKATPRIPDITQLLRRAKRR